MVVVVAVSGIGETSAVVRSLVFWMLSLLSVGSWAAESLLVVTDEAPPAQVLKDGVLTGISTDLIRSALKNTGIKADFRVYPWARAYSTALARPNTLIYSIVRTPQRESKFIWLGVIGKIEMSFVTLSDTTHINFDAIDKSGVMQSEAAQALRLGAVRGDIGHHYLINHGYNPDTYIVRSSQSELLQLLYAKKIDTLIGDLAFLKSMATDLKLDPEAIRSAYVLPKQSHNLYIAANPDTDPTIVSKLTAILK